MPANRVAVIGAGSVGAAVSYAILLRHLVAELLLVDVDGKRCEGEVADLSDGTFLSNCKVRCGTGKEAGQCDVIVITAGAKQREGETRVQLIDRNFAILKAVIGGMQPLNPQAILIVVANPCDILTFFAQQLSGLPQKQVFGSGTFLDTMRLRRAIAQKVQVADTAVHAYVLGEHGDTQFPVWSSAHIGGLPLTDFADLDAKTLATVAAETKNKAYAIISAKGATYFGIAAVVSSIIECIFFDQSNIRPLSVYVPNLRCCISYPCVLGRGGVSRVLPVHLNASEQQQLDASAQSLRAIIEKYDGLLK